MWNNLFSSFLGKHLHVLFVWLLFLWEVEKSFIRQEAHSKDNTHSVCDLLRLVTHLWGEMTTSSCACSYWRGPELHMSGSFRSATSKVRHKYWLKIIWLGQGFHLSVPLHQTSAVVTKILLDRLSIQCNGLVFVLSEIKAHFWLLKVGQLQRPRCSLVPQSCISPFVPRAAIP